MKKRIKKRPAWKGFEYAFANAYEEAAEFVSCYIEAESKNFSEEAGLAFDTAWDKTFDYGKVQKVIRERFNIAFEAALKARNKIPKS